ncbi:MAG: hypothetical protein NC241_07125 [Bacteroides sp.]|nr:hypothetical protein [Bacteroides sp.]MCM1456616.1 hypothetical protein [Lachnoclostridium sp.]
MTKTASDKIASFASRLGQTAKSIVKLFTQRRRATITKADADTSRPLIILANGPSLNQTIAESLPSLQANPTLAVNFAANAPEFRTLRPRYYVLIDPHFFSATDDPNVTRLWDNLARVDWPMTLIVPARRRRLIPASVNIDTLTVNDIAVEGFLPLENAAFARGWGMPRPRNVLIPSIMAAIAMGFKEIYLTGADHSWMKTISVDDNNRVVSIQPHFYKDNDKELARVRTDYLHRPLHTILDSFRIAFASYHTIARFAATRGIRIVNSTPGSYIDAFPRAPLP